MTYRVNDIFYSLQGEGRHTGRAAVFVRMAGCNLRCAFCDTDFEAYEELTAPQIVARMAAERGEAAAAGPMLCVLTGGEPTLQVDEALVEALHAAGYEVAMESNGTREPARGIDWLTVSPKERVRVKRCDELKVIFDSSHDPEQWAIEVRYRYLQPCDTGDARRNEEIVRACIAYIGSHPSWRLSLQTHKLLGFK